MKWSRDEALKNEMAKTRDGRIALGLKKATCEDGTKIIIGVVTVNKQPFKIGPLPVVPHWWCENGFGDGPDDLFDK